MKEKSVFDNFMGDIDNAILSNKIKIHDELKDSIINNNLIKIGFLEKKIEEEKMICDQLKKTNSDLELRLNATLNLILKQKEEEEVRLNIKNNSVDQKGVKSIIKQTNNKNNRNSKMPFNNRSQDEESKSKPSLSPFRETNRSKIESNNSLINHKMMKTVDHKKSTNPIPSLSNKSKVSNKSEKTIVCFI